MMRPGQVMRPVCDMTCFTDEKRLKDSFTFDHPSLVPQVFRVLWSRSLHLSWDVGMGVVTVHWNEPNRTERPSGRCETWRSTEGLRWTGRPSLKAGCALKQGDRTAGIPTPWKVRFGGGGFGWGYTHPSRLGSWPTFS